MSIITLFLLACVGASGGSDSKDDTGTTGGGGGGGGDASLCPDYSGLDHVGQTWTYRGLDGSGTEGTTTTTLVSIDGGQLVLESEGSYVVEGVSDYTMSTRQVLRCDAEGAFSVSYRSDWSYVLDADGQPYSGWSEVDYQGDGYLMTPASMGEGWTTAYTADVVDSYGNETTMSDSFDVTVGDPATISVAAGSYDVLPLTWSGSTSSSTTWVDRDIGTVATEVSELADYRD